MAEIKNQIVCAHCGAVNRMASHKTPVGGKCGRCTKALTSSNPIDVTVKAGSNLLSKDTGMFIVDAWAPWCGPCRLMAPAYNQVATSYGGHLRFFKINVDALPEASVTLGVRGIPALIMFDRGIIIDQKSGLISADQLAIWAKQVFGSPSDFYASAEN